MKTTRLLRVLYLLGFLLLFAPFYDSCDGKYFRKMNNDGTEVKKTFSEKVYKVIIDEQSTNGFELAGLSYYAISECTYTELKRDISVAFKKKDWYRNMGIFVSFIFDFIIIISLSIFIVSFTKKIKLLNKLELVNIILVLITYLYIILFESSFEHFRQIKWGYYAFILTNVLIFYYSKKVITTQNNNFIT